MKSMLFCLVALTACAKTDDLSRLHEEAVTVAKYYQPKLAALDDRIKAIAQRGSSLPATQPGLPNANQLFGMAKAKLAEARALAGSIEKEAAELATKNDAAGLGKLADETREKLEHDITEVVDSLGTVESWLALVKS